MTQKLMHKQTEKQETETETKHQAEAQVVDESTATTFNPMALNGHHPVVLGNDFGQDILEGKLCSSVATLQCDGLLDVSTNCNWTWRKLLCCHIARFLAAVRVKKLNRMTTFFVTTQWKEETTTYI